MSREQGILRVLLGRPFDTLVSCGAQWENTRTGQDRTEECTTQYVLSGSSRFGQLGSHHGVDNFRLQGEISHHHGEYTYRTIPGTTERSEKPPARVDAVDSTATENNYTTRTAPGTITGWTRGLIGEESAAGAELSSSSDRKSNSTYGCGSVSYLVTSIHALRSVR
jgi:hypothetical protein